MSDVGAAQYSLAIAVPDGRMGMAPDLALQYSSSAGNGAFGVGFSLVGNAPPIVRCPTREGRDRRIDYDATAFCMGGERLLPAAGGPDCQTGYRTRNDAYARVCSFGPESDPSYFEVFTRDGRILTYASRARGARMENFYADGMTPSAVLGFVTAEWSVTRQRDRSGNAIEYAYYTSTFDPLPARHPLSHRLTDVTWAGNRRVRLTYEARPDPFSTWSNGVELRQDQRIKSIEVYGPSGASGGSTLQWRYDIAYRADSTTSRSLVESVRLCDPVGACLPATTFDWDLGDIDYATSAPLDIVAGADVMATDLDGDGLDEILMQPRPMVPTDPPPDPAWRYYPNDAGTLGSEPPIGLGFQHRPAVVDVDGDGRTELVAIVEAGTLHRTSHGSFELVTEHSWWIHRQEGPYFLAVQNLGGSVLVDGAPNSIYFADLDGDGLPDQIQRDFDAWWVRRGTGTAEAPFAPRTLAVLGEASPSWSHGGALHLVDLDGDGGQEFVYPPEMPDPTMPPPLVGAHWGDVETAELAVAWAGLGYDHFNYRFMDVNGDGLEDVVDIRACPQSAAGLRVRFNTGNGFTPWSGAMEPGAIWEPGVVCNGLLVVNPPPPDARVWVLDMNGDGRDDLLVAGNHPALYLSTGERFARQAFPLVHDDAEATTAPTTYTPLTRRPPLVPLDVNGDGLPDFATGEDLVVQIRNRRYVDRLLSVTSGAAAHAPRTRFEYGPVGEASLPGSASCQYPVSCASLRMAVVTRILQDTGLGSPTSRDEIAEEHAYGGGRVDALSGAFLGFQRVRVHVPDVGTTVETSYALDVAPTLEAGPFGEYYRFGLQRMPAKRATVAEVDGRVILQTQDYTWSESPAPYAGGYQLHLDHTVRRLGEVAASEWASVSGFALHQRAATAINEHSGAGRRLDQVAYTYDPFGFPSRISYVGLAGRTTTVQLITDQAFSCGLTPPERVGSWLLGLPDRVVVTSEGSDERVETRTTEYCWDDHGLLLEERREPDAPLPDTHGLRLTTRMVGRTAYGQPTWIQETTPDGDARNHSLTYDEASVHLRSYRNPLGHLSQVGYHPSLGVALIEVDANGASATARYDTLGRLRQTIGADGSGGAVSYGPDSVTSAPNGAADTTISFDRRGRAIGRATTGLGGVGIEASAQFDHLGHLVRDHLPRIGGAGPIVHRDFDDLGRLLSVSLERTAGGSHSLFSIQRQYAGDVSTVEDGDGDRRTTYRDLDGVLRGSRDHDGDTEPSVDFELGPFGQVRTAQAPAAEGGARALSSHHDRLGRTVSSYDDDRGSMDYDYDAWGNVRRVFRGGELWTTIEYDAIDRPFRIETPDGVSEFIWDTASGGVGRIHDAIGADGSSVEYRYDGLGRVVEERHAVHGETFVLDYEYDGVGRLEAIAYPASTAKGRFEILYRYDPASGLLVLIEDAEGVPYWELGEHDAFFRPTEEAIGKNWLSTVYDEVYGRPQQLTLRAGRSPGDAPLREILQSFEADGSLRKRTEGVGGREESFEYDSLDRLRGWSLSTSAASRTVTYDYDRTGNLTEVSTEVSGASTTSVTETYRYTGDDGAGPSAVTEIELSGDESDMRYYRYDQLGRQWYADGRTIEYTARDLPRTIYDGSSGALYEYGPFGDRVWEKDFEGEEVFRIGELYERRSGASGTLHVAQVYGPRGLVAEVRFEDAGEPERLFMATDDLGSVLFVTDGAGSLVDETFYDPFGRRLAADGTDAPAGGMGSGVTRGYTGHLHDDAFGLINMRGREYDAVTRRFLSADPLVPAPLFSQSWNAYSYVWNNPTNATDPSGFDGVRITEGDVDVECVPTCPPHREGERAEPAIRNLDRFDSHGWDRQTTTGGNRHSPSELQGLAERARPSEGNMRATVEPSRNAPAVPDVPGGWGGPAAGFTPVHLRMEGHPVSASVVRDLDAARRAVQRTIGDIRSGREGIREQIDQFFGGLPPEVDRERFVLDGLQGIYDALVPANFRHFGSREDLPPAGGPPVLPPGGAHQWDLHRTLDVHLFGVRGLDSAAVTIPGRYVALGPTYRQLGDQSDRIRILIHEAAHLGLGLIGHPSGNDGRNPVDWARFVGTARGFRVPPTGGSGP